MAQIKISSWRFRKMKGFRAKKYVELMDKELIREGKKVLENYERISNQFSKPVYYNVTKPQGLYSRSVTVSTSGNVMHWLDLGTKTRWAVMSNPYRPRTKQNSLRVLSRSGRAMIRGKSAMKDRGIPAMPRIKPRYFSRTIKKRRERWFPGNVQRAIERAANS